MHWNICLARGFHGLMRWFPGLLACVGVLLSAAAFAQTENEQAEPAEPAKRFTLYFDSGQILEHTIRVYVNAEFDSDARPELCLERIQQGADCKTYRPFAVLPNQAYLADLDGDGPAGKESISATLLLFDLSGFWNCPADWSDCLASFKRSEPWLSWKGDGGIVHYAAAQRTYLGVRSSGIFWTLAITLGFVAIVAWFGRTTGMGVWGTVSTADGEMSVALSQMGLWTLAIGAAVLGFGLVRLEIPDIPNSLIVLMGMSVTTSAVGHWQTRKLKRATVALSGGRLQQKKPELSDLFTITVEKPDGSHVREVALASVQIMFWTVITMIAFIVKSVEDGQLWEVPAELVALMGISQTGYMARMQMAIGDSENEARELQERGAEVSPGNDNHEVEVTGNKV